MSQTTSVVHRKRCVVDLTMSGTSHWILRSERSFRKAATGGVMRQFFFLLLLLMGAAAAAAFQPCSTSGSAPSTRRAGCRISAAVPIQQQQNVPSFSWKASSSPSSCRLEPTWRWILSTNQLKKPTRCDLPFLTVLAMAMGDHGGYNNDEDENDDDSVQDGAMADAFRQLESLESLDFRGTGIVPPVSSSTKTNNIRAVVDENEVRSSVPKSLESEVSVYRGYLQEIEAKSEDDLYRDMLADIMEDGEAPPPAVSPRKPTSPASRTTSVNTSNNNKNNEDMWNRAMEEAMDEVRLNNPKISKSIMDDDDFKREVEAIFERGNEKLLASLEEIRKEQSDWARTSAAKTATEAVEQIQADEIRLKLAEDSMRSVLNKVNRETEEVVKATQQLQKVQSELDNDFLYKLKSGGLIKQLSLVGLVLFSFRSLADTLAAVGGGGNNSGDDLTFALIQGAIALACALVFFVL